MPQKSLFLIDGHALCYRAFYAIKNLTTTKGQPTNAVYGFIRAVRSLLKDYEPDYAAICFDSKGKTHREEKFAEYKIQRPPMPDELRSQIPLIIDVMKAFNLAVFQLDGYEADDILATLATTMAKKGVDVVIASDDKDLYQLANGHIQIYSFRKEKILGHKELEEQLGFDPKYMSDFIGLAGDSSDNIPGVKGVGEVTAKQLILEYGSLENILKNVDKIKKESVKEKIKEEKGRAILSKELAILEERTPLEYKLEDLKFKAPDQNRLHAIFKELEFKSLADEFATSNLKDAGKLQVIALKTAQDAALVLEKIHKAKEMIFLLSAAEEQELFDKPSLFICVGHHTIYSVEHKLFPSFKKAFEDTKAIKVTHNLKKTLKILSEFDLTLSGPVFDTRLAAFLAQPASGDFAISDLAWNYLKASIDPKSPHQPLIVIDQIYPILMKELKEKSLLKLFEDIEIPLASVLFKVESQGVCLDLPLLKKLSKECDDKIKLLMIELFRVAGTEFNINSPKQLSQILFEKLGLPVIRKTKTGVSTDESVLIVLAKMHDFPSLILEYRQLTKLKSTYIDALPKLIDSKTGRIHAEFDQIGAETGRLSSRNPNLQNIPIRTDLGRQIRKAFIPSQDSHVILASDYSQVELRILAHLSQDKNLIKAFKTNQDIHTFTASLIFDVDEKKVTAQMRNSAKRINFGIIYGMSAFGLSNDLGISPKEAETFINRYFERYPAIKKYMDHTIEQCEEKGFVLTLFGRRRYIPEIKSSNRSIRQFAQRQAINTPVQGSAADLIKLSMVNIQKEIEARKLKSRMIMTVHDELVFDAPKKEVEEMVELVRYQMEHPLKLVVDIKTSVKVGKNWLDLEEVK